MASLHGHVSDQFQHLFVSLVVSLRKSFRSQEIVDFDAYNEL